jgi:pyrimidine operon attenuation protein/uracil phosphoribosyltransferase/prolyl-tRNA editing enzyme YbaK/EbsC (Cys-tRNA(Pro) deacylase)
VPAVAGEQSESRRCLADRARVGELLDALAAQVRARLGGVGDLVIVGIHRRGIPLARLLAERLGQGRVQALCLKRYSDDLAVLHDQPRLDERRFPLDVDGRTVLLVDDVLYTGRTLRRAVDHLSARGASRVYTAVLCARGGREVPVRADFAGLRLELEADAIVDVHVPPYEPALAIVLRRRPGAPERSSARVLALLDSHGLAYERIRHPRDYTAQETAAHTHTPGRQFAKAVMLRLSDGYAMAVLPAHHHVDLERLGAALGGRQVELASEQQIAELCPDCEEGALPPFGNLYGLRVYASPVLARNDRITGPSSPTYRGRTPSTRLPRRRSGAEWRPGTARRAGVRTRGGTELRSRA